MTNSGFGTISSGDGEKNHHQDGKSPSPPPHPTPTTQPPVAPALPKIGRPGSAFTAYTPQFTSGGASGGEAGSGSRMVVVGGGGGSQVATSGGVLSGNSSGSRKRGKDDGEKQISYECSVCSRSFPSCKSMFGHMRTHPKRAWRGAYPPPAFRTQEEFADVQIINQEPGREEQKEENVPPPPQAPELENVPPPPAPELENAPAAEAEMAPPAAAAAEEVAPAAARGGEEAAAAGVVRWVPDLNRSPPPEYI